MGHKLIVCVGGGIAAYKAPELVRSFIKRGHEVQVLMTSAAKHFATELSLATVSKRPVRSSLLDVAEEGRVGHIELADWADLVVVAPGTANLMARVRAGMADDIVTAVLLATQAQVLWAPAMNTNMWRHPATRENLRVLAERGAQFVGPDQGELACGWVGEGRMIDPEIIVDAAEELLGSAPAGASVPAPSESQPETRAERSGPWKGRRVLISAGPTRAYIDPVRFISNASTGAMGLQLAAAALALGAEVTVVCGPVERPVPEGVERIDIETGSELFAVMNDELGRQRYDLVAMVAAVADFVPVEPSEHKLDKASVMTKLSELEWKQEIDVLATLVDRYRSTTRFLGFAAQTVDSEDPVAIEEELIRYGAEKLERKGPHAVFVNRVGVTGTGFASQTNAGFLLIERSDGPPMSLSSGEPMSKGRLARWLLDHLDRHVMGA